MTTSETSLLRIQAFSLLTLAAIAVGAALHWLTPVMVPFMLALFLTVVLTPLIEMLHERLHLPRVLALVLTGVVGLAGASLLALLVVDSVGQLRASADGYIRDLEAFLQTWSARVGIDASIEELAPSAGELQAWAGALASTLMGIVSQGVLVIIFMLFLVSGRSYSGTLGEVEQRIKGYVVTKGIVSSITGVATWLILWWLGIEMAPVFGLFAFLLNFIPSVGSIIGTLLPLPVLLMGGDYSTTQQVLAIALPGLMQAIVGNVLEPRMLGESMSLHPVTILLALIFWGMIWGFVGTLLATPVTAIVRILLDKLPETRPLAELMAGRLAGAEGDSAS